MTDDHLKFSCVACGFDPNDKTVWKWWRGLSDKNRRELVRLSDPKLAAMPTLTDLGLMEQSITARGVTYKPTSASRNGQHE